MKIEIKNRFTGHIIIRGDYENIRKALEKNKHDLIYADLRDADLRGAYLRGAILTNADLRDADLRYADLRYADLTEADLTGADLTDADLTGAGLRFAKHDFKFPILYIIGSRHSLQLLNNKITIGSESFTIQYWIENYECLGKNNGWTLKQIAEYKKYIDLCAEADKC